MRKAGRRKGWRKHAGVALLRRQLHDVSTAQEHYLTATYVDRNATTLEAAMGVETALRKALGLPARAAKTAKRGG